MAGNSSDIDQTYEKLSDIITKMEEGDLSLEASIKAFEQGIQLTREAQKTIAEAEQKVSLLLDDGGAPATSALTPGDGENG